jgi:hypothetical protein
MPKPSNGADALGFATLTPTYMAFMAALEKITRDVDLVAPRSIRKHRAPAGMTRPKNPVP